jgi:hypothetical protein
MAGGKIFDATKSHRAAFLIAAALALLAAVVIATVRTPAPRWPVPPSTPRSGAGA